MGNGITGSRLSSTSVSLTGTREIDAVLGDNRWNGTTITYSFPSPGTWSSYYSYDQEFRNMTPLSDTLKAAVRQALASWERVANIHFKEVAESSTEAGDLRFGIHNGMSSNYNGWAYYPSNSAIGGDVWLSPTFRTGNITAGSYNYMTLVHEIGHALGLKHPFSISAGNSTTMPSATDNVDYTVMSYNERTAPYPSTPAYYDIYAIQSLYGINTQTTAGNDTYLFNSTDVTIWDYSGTDTLSFQDAAGASNITLQGGVFSTTPRGQTMILPGTIIENAAGSGYSDTITGNDAANTLTGLGGNDTVYAGGGDDVVFGNAGSDVLYGNAGIDVLYGGIDADTLFGGVGNDWLNGNAGNDVVNGNNGNDTVRGGQGNDQVFGGQNEDELWGDLGDDTLSGDLGNDTLWGGAGADRFVFRTGAGSDVIGDFSYGEGDRIQVSAGLSYSIAASGSDAVITFSEGSRVTLVGGAGKVAANWFVVG